MIREQYIQLRNHNNIENIVYIFYTDLCFKKSINPLDVNTFFMIFNQLNFANLLANEIIYKYDIDFNIIKIIKNNKIIKLL